MIEDEELIVHQVEGQLDRASNSNGSMVDM